MDLRNKVVLITGGRRIGSHLARLLAGRGAKLALTYFSSRDAIEATAESCREVGAEAITLFADLREPAAAMRLVQSVVSQWGRLDVLVNLTSIYERTPFETLNAGHFEAAMASNLTAPYHVAVAAGQQMLSQPVHEGIQGKIIHFTDWAIERPYRDFLPYLIAKGALATLTKALAVELAPYILVNAIAPGTVEPPPDMSSDQLQRIRESSLLGKTGTPEDVNQAVLYLLEGTDFVTGEIYRVDGGRFLGGAGRCGPTSG